MKTLITGFIFLFFLTTGDLLAQIKYEKEARIKVGKVPLPARQFVDSLEFTRRVRWYAETSERGKSIEAKSKRKGQKFSVEFNPSGRIQDIEIGVGWHELPSDTRSEIERNLNAEFERYKIRKVQQQFSGIMSDLLEYLRQPDTGNRVLLRYEIVLKGGKDDETNEFEYTYSAEGRLEKKAKLVFRNTDNLEY